MELEVGFDPFLVQKKCVSCFRVFTSGNFFQSGLKMPFFGQFLKKKA